MNVAAQPVFTSAIARRNFVLAGVATFLAFSTYSQLAMLAVVLRGAGMSDRTIGLLLSSPLPVVFVVMLLSGRLIVHHGSTVVLKFGLCTMSLAYVSLQFTNREPLLACLSLMGFSAGYGIFMPATMTYAGAQLAQVRRAYYFGIYTSMIPLPTVVGPPLAELLLKSVGADWYFLASAVPALLGAAMAVALTGGSSDRSMEQPASWGRYVELVGDTRVRSPYLGIFIVGIVYGFAVSFMGLLLVTHGVAVAYFFSSYMVCFMLSRFLLLRFLVRVPRHWLVAAGLVGMSLAYTILALRVDAAAAFAAGTLFGLGYSVCFPTLIGQVVDEFEEVERGMPIALFNAMFAIASYALPVAGGIAIARSGAQWLVGCVAAFGFCGTALFVAVSAAVLRNRPRIGATANPT